MLHAVDLGFASNRGYEYVKRVHNLDASYDTLSNTEKEKKCLATPACYAKLVFETLGIDYCIGDSLDVWNMVLNPEILIESYDFGWNRIKKDRKKDFRFIRFGALLLHMIKR